MNSLLIYPEWPDTYWSFKHVLPFAGKRAAYAPLSLLTVASLLPSHWNKRLVDMNVQPLKEADLKWADVALLSGMLIHKDDLLSIMQRCRARGLRTVIGGPITTSPEILTQYADHVVIGEAEDLIAELAQDLERGQAKPVYRAAKMPDLARTPVPDLSLISPRHYGSMAIQYSRGCPFNCEFCDIIEVYGRRPRTKSIPQVIAELDALYDRKWRGPVFFVDDNFIGNKKSVKELLPAVAEWNHRRNQPFNFFTEASINLSDDQELLQSMRDAGFFRVFVGIETPAEASLKEAQKLQNTRRSLVDSVRRLQKYGMEVMAGFIVGFDNDPEDIFDQQVKFINDAAIPMAMVGLLQALPGTQLYRRLFREGRIVDEANGNNTNGAINFRPVMDVNRLLEGYRSVMKRIYDHESYYDRVRHFLNEYKPAVHLHRSFSDYKALLSSMVRQGVFDSQRSAYWKFFLDAATKYRYAFGTAITLAIMGHHFRMITDNLCNAEGMGG
jgi:radical SAM superfamily enzyme YgiQ (UPF0313 family)